MICLAMDTASSVCAACLYDGGRDVVLAEKSEDIGKGHAERLMGIVSEVMAEAGIGYGDLTKIVTTIGPGSFTGIRVGVATARGFGLGLGIPVVGVSNLEGMLDLTRKAISDGPSIRHGAIIDARRGKVYAILDFDSAFGPAEVPFIAETADFCEAVERSRLPGGADILAIGCVDPEGVCAAVGAAHIEIVPLVAVPVNVFARLGAEFDQDAHRPEPLYLRQPDAVPQTGFAVERAS